MARSRLGGQIAQAAAFFGTIGARFALIGGLALATHKVIRATQDLEDIRALLRTNRAALDVEELRECFQLFDRESLLDDPLRQTR